MKNNRLMLLLFIITILIFSVFGCDCFGVTPEVDGGRDSTSYTYDKMITITYYHDNEFLDSVYFVGEENDPLLCGTFYRFSYKDNELIINMRDKYYMFNIKDDLLHELSNDEFANKYSDYGKYKWIYPHGKYMKS